MQIQLFRKGAHKPLKAKKEVPAAYNLLQLPHASNSYLPLGNGGMFLRNIKASGFDLSILDCWADESISLEISADSSFLTVVHVINGSVSLNFRNTDQTPLAAGHSYLLYLPPASKNELRIEAGEHRLLVYGTGAESLRELGKNLPVVSLLLEKIKGVSKVAHCIGETKLAHDANEFIRELEEAKESTRRLITEIHNRIFELLCLQVQAIAKNGSPGAANPVPGWIERLPDARKMVDERTGSPLRISSVARKCRMNDRQLKLGFRLRYGAPFAQYQIEVRLERARKLLLDTDDPVQTIGLMVGYEDESSFTKRFKRSHGLTPLQYRRKYRP